MAGEEGGIDLRGPPRLPPPITDEILQEMLLELPTGARLATMTCYNCWKERKFPTAEFMSFLQSIAAHSPLLARLFENHRIGDGGGHAGPDEVLDKDRLSAGRGMGEGGALHGGGAGLEVAGGLSSFHGGGIHQMGESQNSAARGTQDTHTVPPPPPPTHMQHGRGHGESLHILHKQPQRHASAAAAVLDSVEARRGAGVDVMVVGEGGCEYVMESENMDLEDLGRDSSSLAGSNAESDCEESEIDRAQHERRLVEIQRRRLEE
eukprot:CAMPEP_0179417596 /NCGR_PEP_ID=MMETSP0799-20121207/7457_1 /TAXON_ID=46947 /ORGANISM="Geminigera cryophila, Strain CCMP2564" /LENGTH=263 /DNA_ID=CAMNT_0021190627 /DNA_START=60 /DNA_END=848 /DNA_ORIENTATION=-